MRDDEETEIPEADLVEGQIYEVRSRNLSVGVWRPQTRGFIGLRVKFSARYLFEEYHWDTGPPFGTARAIRELEGFKIPKRLLRRYDERTDNKAMFRVIDALDKLVERVNRVEYGQSYEYALRSFDMTSVKSESALTPKANFQRLDGSNEGVAWRLADMYERRTVDVTKVYPIVVRRRVTEWEVVRRDLDRFPVKEE